MDHGHGLEQSFDSKVKTTVIFQLSRTQLNYLRQVDTCFDLLASLGGLLSALAIVCKTLVSLLQFYGSYQFIMHDLFTERKTKIHDEPGDAQ